MYFDGHRNSGKREDELGQATVRASEITHAERGDDRSSLPVPLDAKSDRIRISCQIHSAPGREAGLQAGPFFRPLLWNKFPDHYVKYVFGDCVGK
jgi:hypothetical protein